MFLFQSYIEVTRPFRSFVCCCGVWVCVCVCVCVCACAIRGVGGFGWQTELLCCCYGWYWPVEESFRCLGHFTDDEVRTPRVSFLSILQFALQRNENFNYEAINFVRIWSTWCVYLTIIIIVNRQRENAYNMVISRKKIRRMTQCLWPKTFKSLKWKWNARIILYWTEN